MADSDSIKLCECGCGKPAPIARQTRFGQIKGQPCRFRRGHAMSAHRHSKPRSPTYRSWLCMMQRCSSPKYPGYDRYGGAGITVCERWKDFGNFLADMGERPNGRTLDRHPNQSGNYEPSNCRWATTSEQQRNKSTNIIVEHEGKSLCLAEWAEIVGVHPSVLYMRYRKYGDRPPRLFRPIRGNQG